MADFEAIVVGSGFAGAVTACRLAQAELRVCVLERGRRYEASYFPIYPKAERPAADGGGSDRIPPDFTRALWKMGHGLRETLCATSATSLWLRPPAMAAGL